MPNLLAGVVKVLKINKSSYILFSFFVAVIMACISLIISEMTYHALRQEAEMNLQFEANRIENALSTIIYEIETLMVYTGKRIAKEDPANLIMIWNHINDVFGRKASQQRAWDWPNIAWVNKHHQQVVDHSYGISSSYDVSIRKYTLAAQKTPWQLHFDPPAYGIPNNRWKLVGGVGVEDDDGSFLGILAIGFDITDLTARIAQVLVNQQIQFAVFDREHHLISHSPSDKDFSSHEGFFHFIVNQDGKKIDEGSTDILAYASFLRDYPFIVITYIKKEILTTEWIPLMTLHVIEVAGIGAFCLLLLYFFWKRLYKKNKELDKAKRNLEHVLLLAKSSDAAKEEFLRCINHELTLPLNAIVNHTDTLLKSHITDMQLVLERQIELLEDIINHALAFKDLTNNVLQLTDLSIKKVIEECVTIHSKSTFDKSIKIFIQISDNIPKLRMDELKIKQVFVALLSRAIKYSLPGGKIEIKGTEEIKKGALYVKIVFKDEGLGLSDDMLAKIAERLDSFQEKIDQIEMDFVAVERIIHMHKGNCTMESHPGHGTSITLLFPALELNETFPKKKKKSVLPFSCS
jgi:signal transduction histidine kinase